MYNIGYWYKDDEREYNTDFDQEMELVTKTEEIAEYDRLGKPYDVTTLSNSKFEVGKWYDFDNPDYRDKVCAKFFKLSDNKEFWYFSEYIGNKNHEFYNGNWFSHKCTGKLTDLLEIQEYLPDGHVDIVKSESKSLVGRYLKALFDNPNGTNYKKGDYILIAKDDFTGLVECSKDYIFGERRYDWKKCDVELMPEGFIPETVEKVVHINKSDSFVLPEKWCVIADKLSGNYFNEQSNNKCYNFTNGYYHRFNYKETDDITIKGNYAASFHRAYIKKGYTEITFEQFKKYVLDKNENNEIKLVEKKYTIEEALEQIQKLNLQIGDKIYYRYDYGRLDKDDIMTVVKLPEIKVRYIDCGRGYLWHIDYPHLIADESIIVERVNKSKISENDTKEFKFPEKWCIKSCKEVGDWLDENSDLPKNLRLFTGYASTTYEYLYYPSLYQSHIYSKPEKEGYIEITIEQFRKYVLKENNNLLYSIKKEINSESLIDNEVFQKLKINHPLYREKKVKVKLK